MSERVETAELEAFTKAVDARSLSRAAAELGVPRATISRRLARLENRLGIRLLRRTTRSLAMTEAGTALYMHAQIVLDAVRHAEASVRRADEAVRGDLRISVPTVLPPSFRALVCDFAQRYPDVRIHLHASNRRVDLHRDGYDAALRAGLDLEPGLIARKLATSLTLLVAAPAYLAKHGVPRNRRELARHRCLLGFGSDPRASYWPLPRGGRLHVNGSFLSNDLGMLCDAAIHGLGLALLPLQIVRPHLESGALVPVLHDLFAREAQIAIVYPERAFMSPQLRAFVDAVAAWAPTEFDPGLPVRYRAVLSAMARRRPRLAPG